MDRQFNSPMVIYEIRIMALTLTFLHDAYIDAEDFICS